MSCIFRNWFNVHYATKEWRQFDYERDLLSRLDWDSFSFRKVGEFEPDDQSSVKRTETKIDVEDLNGPPGGALPGLESFEDDVEPEIDFAALVRVLLDVIPNPWQGARMLEDALAVLRKRQFSEKRLFTNRLALIKAMKDDLKEQVSAAGEAEFRRMLAAGELSFKLVSSNDPVLNWALAETLELDVTDDDKQLLRKEGGKLERSFFEPVYQKQVNGLEKEVAWYLDEQKAVQWWHRIAVHQDWHLQGWQKQRVYPDFLASLHDKGDGKLRFTVLETKGLHLAGNEDTEYKRRLFEVLTEFSKHAQAVGEVKIEMKQKHLRFELLLDKDWRVKLPGIFDEQLQQ